MTTPAAARYVHLLEERHKDMRAGANEDESNTFLRFGFRSKAETYALILEELPAIFETVERETIFGAEEAA